MGCHVGLTYAGAFGNADDVALVAQSPQRLKEMTSVCEHQYSDKHGMNFSQGKSKLLCYNVDSSTVAPVLGYEPADLTLHPPLELPRVGAFFCIDV